jgi:hypothetical protein
MVSTRHITPVKYSTKFWIRYVGALTAVLYKNAAATEQSVTKALPYGMPLVTCAHVESQSK